MDNVKELQAGIVKLKKHLSLRQIAIQSRMNYITLRNIASGKTVRVTDKVADQLKKFVAGFDPVTAVPVLQKRGRKPGVKNAAPAKKTKAAKTASAAPAVPAAPKVRVKRGRKPGSKNIKPAVAAAPAPVNVPAKRGRKPGSKNIKPAVAAAPAPANVPAKRGRKPGSKNIKPAVTAASAPVNIPAKRGRKPGRKPGRKLQPAVTAPVAEFSQVVLGAKLRDEIAMVEARLSYLKTLEKAEAAYLTAIRRK